MEPYYWNMRRNIRDGVSSSCVLCDDKLAFWSNYSGVGRRCTPWKSSLVNRILSDWWSESACDDTTQFYSSDGLLAITMMPNSNVGMPPFCYFIFHTKIANTKFRD